MRRYALHVRMQRRRGRYLRQLYPDPMRDRGLRVRRRPLHLISLVALLAGCGDAPSSPVVPASPMTLAERMDPAACAGCHPEEYRTWSRSMHAVASDDPIFVAMNARAQRESRGALGSFCIRCHP